MSDRSQASLWERLLARVSPSLELRWANTKEALWFLPAVAVMLAVILAIGVVYADNAFELWQGGRTSPWLFGAGAEGARGVLTAIAGSVITVVGTVFSITIVGLQLASSQFTPRVMRQFTGDRVNQSVLAVYIGTFTYCLLVLRTVEADGDDAPGFVPVLGVSLAIGLALLCIALLIVFIHHMARQMQVAVILHRASRDALGLVESYFRDEVEISPALTNRPYAVGGGQDVVSDSTGYLQQYDVDHLMSVAQSRTLTIRILVPMGAFLNTRQPIARIWSADSEEIDLDRAGRAVRDAFVTGSERTLHADLPLGIRQIADIGIKALSPGINDPTTATQALDRLSEVLARAGSMASPERILYIDDRPAVFLPRIGFDELTNIAFTQIRHYGKTDLVVMLHLTRTIERVAALVDDNRQSALLRHLALVRAAGEQGLTLGPEREVLMAEVDSAVARIEDRARNGGDRAPAVPDMIVHEV